MNSQNTSQNQGQAVVNAYSGGQATSAQTSGSQPSVTGGQASQVVIGVFNARRDAEQAVEQLRQQGFTQEEINIVAKKGSREDALSHGHGHGQARGQDEYVDDDITDGALTGGTLGGIGGLVLGVGALAIPGVGPIIAAGPIAAALGGAVAGGVAGGLIDWGIPSQVSHHYEQEIAHGGILAIIQTSATKVNQAAQILRQNGARDVESHQMPSAQQQQALKRQ